MKVVDDIGWYLFLFIDIYFMVVGELTTFRFYIVCYWYLAV